MKGKNWFQAVSIKLLLVFDTLVPRTCLSHQPPTNPLPKSCSVLYHHCCLGLQTSHLLKRKTKFCFAMSEEDDGNIEKWNCLQINYFKVRFSENPVDVSSFAIPRKSLLAGGHTLTNYIAPTVFQVSRFIWCSSFSTLGMSNGNRFCTYTFTIRSLKPIE